MSFADRLMLWLHVAFTVFTIGPVTVATMSSPRAIRTGNVAVLRYLMLVTAIFGAVSLGVPAFGVSLGQSLGDLGETWLTVAITLYVVAVVLLVIILRDQRRAVTALEAAREEAAWQEVAGQEAAAVTRAAGEGPPPATDAGPAEGTSPPEADGDAGDGDASGGTAGGGTAPAEVASVERGRIASISGLVALLWLAILVLMVWNS